MASIIVDHHVSCSISETSPHVEEALLSNIVRYPANDEVPNAHNRTRVNDRPMAVWVVQVVYMAYSGISHQVEADTEPAFMEIDS